MIDVIKNNMLKEDNLSENATKSSESIRLKEDKDDIRPAYYRDIDRIIHCLSYTRYIDKTQVFSNNENDNVSKRIVHVQLVSKIARTIGRALKLNEDLIEAISLGHDIGHVPFGHTGERILNKLSIKYNEGYFNHNVQSVRTLMNVEKNGVGSNLTIQVLDGILCHNGEFISDEYKPIKKTKEDFLNDYENSYKIENYCQKLIPMTLEGCVVRISDVIGYIGRDIEDAINVGILKKEEIPKKITDILGDNNKQIVNTIVLDIIKNSYDKPYIKMSDEVLDSLKLLKKFNYANIYDKANTKEEVKNYEVMFESLFEKYMSHLENKEKDKEIYTVFLNNMNDEYKKNTNARIVIDFIAGMTDDYFINEYNKYFK